MHNPHLPFAPAHDSFTGPLNRLEPDPGTLWAEAEPRSDERGRTGPRRLDYDKPYVTAIELVGRHWSGKTT